MIKIHSIESLGTFDGPGIRLVFFLQGCNFKCLYCANPDTINFSGGKEYEAEALLQMAVRQRPFFGKRGGVTVSGGEPLMQANDLIGLFGQLKQEGINTCIDTNGSILTSQVKELLKLNDLVLLDIKHIDPGKHSRLTATSNSRTMAFAEYLAGQGHTAWVRYVLVPGYTDDEADMHALGRRLATMSNVEKFEIQPYHKLGVHKYESLGWEYRLNNVPANTPEQLRKAKSIFEKYVKEVVIN